MRFQKIAVALLAVAVAAAAGGLMFREAFRPGETKPLVSSLESGCKNVTDTDCVELTNRCHRGREVAACEALARLRHMRTKLDNVRRATRADAGHPAHEVTS